MQPQIFYHCGFAPIQSKDRLISGLANLVEIHVFNSLIRRGSPQELQANSFYNSGVIPYFKVRTKDTPNLDI